MARTRNRQMKQAEAFVQASPKKIWKAGIYTRISVDINGEKRESLETQKLIALSYAESHPDIEVVKFYKDDGISGTKFDRDDFVRMLGDIKTKEINTVIVKDLSRFGRDLEEVSKYLEKIFPFMQVRFISVNDNYDSISPECDNQMLGIMISNLANDMYAKDASVKMTSAMKIKMESGEYCGGDAPYGYKRARDEKGKSTTVPDPLTAPYVVEIFEKLAAGQSYLKISREFNTMLLASPRVYARTGKLFLDRIDETDMHWQSSVIKQIAENRHYLGNTYSHKTRTSLLTKEKNVMLDKEEWIEHVNTHKAIVSAELFEKVQNVIKLKQEKALPKKDLSNMQTHGKQDNKYVGLIYCGDCGANMVRRYYYSEKNGVLYYNYYFICGNYAKISKEKYNCNRWKEEVIDELVYRALIMQLKTVCELKTQLKRFNGEYFETFQKYLNREQSKIVQLNKRNEARRFELYEQYVSGEIDTDAYNRMTERITVVEKDLVTRQKEIEKSRKITEKLCKKNFSWLAEFSKGKNLEFLTKDVVRSYIKKISLYEDKRIEIEFKFQDEIQALSEILEEGGDQMSDGKCIVKYLRLSLEDEDMLDESNSITNQRIVIGQYIASKNEFKNTEVLEFKDDGYSGTNFDRPGFQSMMELVRDGKVSTIIVKDLSRFGRNHIEVDTYLEQIFPFMNVRFIAINDNVDSMKYESGMPGIDVGFRNIINEHHSIDTSVKVKRTLIQRQKAGKYMGARAPYGYLKPDEDVTSLVINPETAPVVKMIFQKYLDGMNITQLARYLNEQKIMSPGQYKREVLKTGVKKTTEKYIWYPVTVRLILMTETYTGTTIGGKWKVASVGSNKHLKTKEEDWIVVEGTHEAIVSKEVFDAVQEKLELNSRKRSKTHNNNYPLKGLVKCGGCGQNLQHVTRCNPHFKCPRKFNAANQDCVTDNLYDDEFNEMIFRAIKLFAKISDDAEPVLELQKAELKSKVNGAAKKIRDAKDSISRYKHQKTELYMRYAMEEISEEEFTRKNDKLDKQIEKETLAIAQMETEQSEAAERLFELPPDGRQCLTDLIEGNKQLTREIAVTFIRGIKVYNDKRIEIEWNFADELVKYVEQVQKICS